VTNILLGVTVAMAASSWAQDPRKPDPGAGKVDETRVEDVIRKRVACLRTQAPSLRSTSPVRPGTCYSILFLRRATRPLVASEDRVIRAREDGK
jgi:hypothetical protein